MSSPGAPGAPISKDVEKILIIFSRHPGSGAPGALGALPSGGPMGVKTQKSFVASGLASPFESVKGRSSTLMLAAEPLVSGPWLNQRSPNRTCQPLHAARSSQQSSSFPTQTRCVLELRVTRFTALVVGDTTLRAGGRLRK